jgi:hypothetical protein
MSPRRVRAVRDFVKFLLRFRQFFLSRFRQFCRDFFNFCTDFVNFCDFDKFLFAFLSIFSRFR